LSILESCCLRPMMRNSVLEELRVRRFADIQEEMCFRAVWRVRVRLTLKPRSGVTQGHWFWYQWNARVSRLRLSSPVLTATQHSYGSLAWLSEFFFRLTSGGQTPQPISTQNGSNDVHSRKDDTFAVKISPFHTPWSPGPLKGQNFANFWT